eukprot:4411077-Pyramimonas_sp.AAC.1
MASTSLPTPPGAAGCVSISRSPPASWGWTLSSTTSWAAGCASPPTRSSGRALPRCRWAGAGRSGSAARCWSTRWTRLGPPAMAGVLTRPRPRRLSVARSPGPHTSTTGT